MATANSTITVRIDTADLTDTLGVLSQAFQDCADALLAARDKLDEATATAEREAGEEPDHVITIRDVGEIGQATWRCTCGADPEAWFPSHEAARTDANRHL